MNLEILIFIELLAEYTDLINLKLELVRLFVILNKQRLPDRSLLLTCLHLKRLQRLVPTLKAHFIGLLGDRFIGVSA
jgi:hypothetical protein